MSCRHDAGVISDIRRRHLYRRDERYGVAWLSSSVSDGGRYYTVGGTSENMKIISQEILSQRSGVLPAMTKMPIHCWRQWWQYYLEARRGRKGVSYRGQEGRI